MDMRYTFHNELPVNCYFLLIIPLYSAMTDIEKSMENLQVQDDVSKRSNFIVFQMQLCFVRS